MERTFDRLAEFDERSRLYRAVDLIQDYWLRSYTWGVDVWNDQGYEGACVGFAWSHELSARPKIYRVYADGARKIYKRAQVLDQWPGEDYEGTSVLAGIKAVQELKGINGLPLIQEYRWAFGIEEVVRVVGRRGPLVLLTVAEEARVQVEFDPRTVASWRLLGYENRDIADDRDLMDWLTNFIFPAEAKNVDREFVKWGTRLAAAEMIRSGTTTFADMYYFEEAVAKAAAEGTASTPTRMVFAGCAKAAREAATFASKAFSSASELS